MRKTEWGQLGQSTCHEVSGWRHTVTLNGTVLYRGWSADKAEKITDAVTLAIDSAGQDQLVHCNQQLRDRAQKAGLTLPYGDLTTA